MVNDKTFWLENEVARLKSAVKELSVLNKLALSVSAARNPDDVLDTIVHEAIKAVEAHQGSIKLLTKTEDHPLQTLIRQRNDEDDGFGTFRLNTEITGWVLQHKQPLLVNDLADDERFKTSVKENRDIRSVLCVPIFFQSQMLGILMVLNKKAPEGFTDSDLRLLTIMAAQSGQLIRNAQLQQEALQKERLQQELDLARRIQLDMLPSQSPQIEGLEVASYFSSARSVGGDYYDFIQLAPQRLLLVMADVSGHGPSAALVMTLLKGVIRSTVADAHISSRLLRKINSIISQIIPAELFITLQFIYFDLQKKTIAYLNAGHNPLLFYGAQTGDCDSIELHSCALNVLPDFEYPLREMSISSGDVIVAYTDGISEAMDANGQMFGLQRMKSLIQNNSTQSAQGIVQNIQNELDRFTGGTEQNDDRALVVVKVLE